MREFFAGNREKVKSDIENGSILLLMAGKAPKKRGDENYPFTPDRNFYYLTGIDKENLIYMMVKYDDITDEYLFIERFDEVKAKWTGAVIKGDECREISGIENIKFLDEFKETLAGIMFNKRIKNVWLDLENRDYYTDSVSIKMALELRERYPDLKIKDIYPIIAEYRMIKENVEIEKIKKAIDITGKGIYAMMENAKAGMYEYEIEAYFDFVLKKCGVQDFAFKSIAAKGKNATVLHYSENNSGTEDGDLILFDVGAQWEYYNGDITRTFPVNGKFTERQRVIYNIVLEGQRKVIEAIKPRIPFKSLNEILKDHYSESLRYIGLIETKEEVSKYYYHGVSHLLGLETHDVGRHNEGLLKKGMVLTVEPGLYIAEEGIGIRIEDDVLVTEDGCEVLSKNIIRTADDIEKYMAENGYGKN